MTLRPGSAAWLLRHEVKLTLRARSLNAGVLVTFGSVLWVLLHAGAWFLLRVVPRDLGSGAALMAIGVIAVMVISLMVAQAITLSVDALFVRGDLDLLLASPILARTVFLVRSLGIAAACVGVYGFFVTPFANMGPFTGHAGLLALYPALVALALLTTAGGMLLTLLLVRWLGARRARVVAQVLGAVIGAGAFLASQAPNMLGHDIGNRISGVFHRWTTSGGALGPTSMVWSPVRALTGDVVPLLALLVVSIVSFWLMANLACRYFLAGTQQSVTAPRRIARGRHSFGAGLTRNVLRKEWKLIARDPSLIAQTLLQMLYAVPLVFVLLRRDTATSVLAPLLILIATTLAGNLAWITVAAEDAPELIGSAPVSLVRLAWLKVVAAVLPVWILFAPVVVVAMRERLLGAVVTVSCMLASTASAGAMQVLYPQRGKRTDLKRRARSSMLISLLEVFTGIAWSALAWTTLFAPRFAVLAIPLVLLGPGVAWMLGRERRAALRT